MTIVFKVSKETMAKMTAYFARKKRDKTPPYAIFQADEADTIITLYQSGKAMFQGPSADIDANVWKDIERKLTGNSPVEKKTKKENNATGPMKMMQCTTIGSDEVGTGDYFGPVVVTASYVPQNKITYLQNLGVNDSKKLTDEKIISIAPTLIKEISHCTYILDNKSYNSFRSKGYNMNQVKAILHNKVLVEMKKEHQDYDKIVVDQFEYPKKYYEHIKGAVQIVNDITFITKAESICMSVAVSSCICRYIFLKKMKDLSNEMGMILLKGAGEEVDKQAADIVKKYGENKLNDIAKLNFKNTDKLKEYLK